MNKELELSVRDMQESDIELITKYWQESDPAYLTGMGVDLKKMPSKENFTAMLEKQLSQPVEEKLSYCIIWQVNGEPVGHSNINQIKYGEEAWMHLHLWYPDVRMKGLGAALVKMTLPSFFQNFQLKRLICEPYALNPAPHKTLERVGFDFIREYTTVPGSINFEQPVKRWELSYDKFKKIASL